jgi:hypothetical protein
MRATTPCEMVMPRLDGFRLSHGRVASALTYYLRLRPRHAAQKLRSLKKGGFGDSDTIR